MVNPSTYSHSFTSLQSPTIPLRLQNLHPRDASSFAHLLAIAADDGKPPRDHDSAVASIGRLNAAAAVPTVLEDGKRTSGPKSVNLLVVKTKEKPLDGEESDYEVIGLGGFGAIKSLERNGQSLSAGDVGVVLSPDYRGKGYAVEAMRLSIDWAFRRLGDGGLQFDVVTVTTREENDAMRGLIKKLGLKGGIIREGEFGGKEIYWEVTGEEWKAIQPQV